MISVINKFEIDHNPSSSAADISFSPMENSLNEEPRVSSDPESRVSENGDRFDSPSPDSASGSRVSDSDELSLSILGFKTGDMVWGKVKSHPWWPGHIFNESFASPSVRRTKHEGHVLVAFFGDSSYGWFDPAELIPYAPNFVEKSKQTTSRSFQKAVEESVDESSRRAALGLSCMCRNPYNFRPTHVPGYFIADVPGFERGGLYSSTQIEKSREEFDPVETLVFLQGLALEPAKVEQREIGMIKRSAQLLAIRRACFEEFDETYAQAFGVQPTRPAQDKLEDEPEKFAPRVAPLSGPLVIAEALGDKKKKKSYFTQPSPLSPSSKKKKKNNYLLKRRDEVPTAATFLPDAYFGQHQHPEIKAPSPPSQTQHQPEVLDYVLQKREPQVTSDDPNPKPEFPNSPPDAEILKTTMPSLPATEFPAPILVDQKMVADSNEGSDGTHVVLKKEKIKKRPRVDRDDKGGEVIKKKKKKKLELLGQDEIIKKKKKKKLELLGQDAPLLSSKKAAMGIENDQLESAPVVSTPELDLESLGPLDLPELLADLSALAMDPFYGVDRNTPTIVRHVFLKFRSIVYEKSLVLPAASESDSQEVQPGKPSIGAPPKEAKQKRAVVPKVKLGSLFKRSLDPTKAGRKRAPSDRQEEISAKRLKKLNQLKSLSNEKKAASITQTTPSKDSNAAPSSASDSVRKPEKQEPLLPLPPKKESPTNLILKFPPRSTLPSVANLKARFARFGPIIVERCRVLWSTHTCKVQFKYKVDALEAYNYVQDNNLFGQIQVVYSVREVELPGSESQFRPGNGTGGSMAQPRTSYQHGQLKSILKKPGDDPGKENQRVKFRLAEDSKSEPMPVTNVSFPNRQLSPPSSSLPATSIPPPKPTSVLLPSSLPPPRSTTFLSQPSPLPRQIPPQRQLPMSQIPLLQPSPLRAFETRPPLTQYTESHLRQQVQQYGGSGFEGASMNTKNKIDISHRMLSLMLRCNDIVTNLQSVPGFVPFRSL